MLNGFTKEEIVTAKNKNTDKATRINSARKITTVDKIYDESSRCLFVKIT